MGGDEAVTKDAGNLVHILVHTSIKNGRHPLGLTKCKTTVEGA
jgi:hypothetical protein